MEKEIILNTDEYCLNLLEQKKLSIWHSINCLLDAYKVNHLSTDYMPITSGSIDEWIAKYHYILKSELDSHPGRLKDFNGITNGIKKTSCLHETEEGHIAVADYIYDQITRRYSEINVIEKPYTKLKDIYVEPPYMTEERKGKHNLLNYEYLHKEWGRNIYYLSDIGIDWTSIPWRLGMPQPSIKP